MRILQVVSKYSPTGVIGGPYTVAITLCNELARMGYHVTLLSQSENQVEISRKDSSFNFLILKSKLLSKKFNPSSLIPISGYFSIFREVYQSKVVHIHFARDFLPIIVAVMCRLAFKPYVLQCHGMVVDDERLSIKILDKFVVKPLLRNARKVLVLTFREMERMPLELKNGQIIGNGISLADIQQNMLHKEFEVIFLGRLNWVKCPLKYIEVIQQYNLVYRDAFTSLICGPDGGQLNLVKNQLLAVGDPKILYLGALDKSSVYSTLQRSKVLFMPSERENFPIALIESMANGTPILIFNHFDISPILLESFPEMVIDVTATCDEIIHRLNHLSNKSTDTSYVNKIKSFVAEKFDIAGICSQLISETYL